MRYTKVVTLKISETQNETLCKLRVKKIRVSNFIREAIKEKIQRDYKELIKKPKKHNCPF
jgi:post-segregation antitoxin (ccd killing protein)